MENITNPESFAQKKHIASFAERMIELIRKNGVTPFDDFVSGEIVVEQGSTSSEGTIVYHAARNRFYKRVESGSGAFGTAKYFENWTASSRKHYYDADGIAYADRFFASPKGYIICGEVYANPDSEGLWNAIAERATSEELESLETKLTGLIGEKVATTDFNNFKDSDGAIRTILTTDLDLGLDGNTATHGDSGATSIAKKKSGLYNVKQGAYIVGQMLVTVDSAGHAVHELMFSTTQFGASVEGGGTFHTEKMCIKHRWYNIDSSHGTAKTWTAWEDQIDDTLLDTIMERTGHVVVVKGRWDTTTGVPEMTVDLSTYSTGDYLIHYEDNQPKDLGRVNVALTTGQASLTKQVTLDRGKVYLWDKKAFIADTNIKRVREIGTPTTVDTILDENSDNAISNKAVTIETKAIRKLLASYATQTWVEQWIDDNVNRDVTELQSDVDDLKPRMSAVETKASNNQTAINNLNSSVSGLQQNKANKSDLIPLQSSIASLQQDKANKSEIENLRQEIEEDLDGYVLNADFQEAEEIHAAAYNDLNTRIDELASKATKFIKVNTLPSVKINPNAIYLVPAIYPDGTLKDYYDEYIYDADNTRFERIGSTSIKIDDFATNAEFARYIASLSGLNVKAGGTPTLNINTGTSGYPEYAYSINMYKGDKVKFVKSSGPVTSDTTLKIAFLSGEGVTPTWQTLAWDTELAYTGDANITLIKLRSNKDITYYGKLHITNSDALRTMTYADIDEIFSKLD